MTTDSAPNSPSEMLENYIEMVENEFHHRSESWKPRLSEHEIYEVLGALMARQVVLTLELASNPPIWNEHVAPLLLRSMVDCHINFAWIFNDPLERSRLFIEYGLGQEKLQLEHLKAKIVAEGGDSENSESLKLRESWIEWQKYTYLTEVTIGNWSGIDARKMAEEAACLDIYNSFYQAYSSATHNTWNHIGKFNIKVCKNPLHKYHFIPQIDFLEPNIRFALDAASILQKTFELFDRKTNNQNPPQSAYVEFERNLKEQISQIEDL